MPTLTVDNRSNGFSIQWYVRRGYGGNFADSSCQDSKVHGRSKVEVLQLVPAGGKDAKIHAKDASTKLGLTGFVTVAFLRNAANGRGRFFYRALHSYGMWSATFRRNATLGRNETNAQYLAFRRNASYYLEIAGKMSVTYCCKTTCRIFKKILISCIFPLDNGGGGIIVVVECGSFSPCIPKTLTPERKSHEKV